MSWKMLVGGAIVAGGGLYLLRMQRTSKYLETITTANVHDISFTDLKIRVNVKLKNPSDNTLKIKYPYIRLSYKDQAIGSSQVADQDITIPQHGETSIKGIIISIPLLSLGSLANDLLKLLKGSPEGIALQATTISTIDIGLGKPIPYEKNETITLKKPVNGAA